MARSSERGAVLIHVAVGLTALLMFVALVIDYGALLGARAQSQSAADAGALAGAAALGFDTPANPTATYYQSGSRWDRARNVAWNISNTQYVWGEHPGVVPTSPYQTARGLCHDTPEACVRVDVYRDGTNGSSNMGTWLSRLFGTDTQGIKAMAVAQTAPASGSSCMKPWLIPDRWDDANGNGVFDVGETYTAPTKDPDGTIHYGTGWTPQDIGTQLTLKAGNPQQAISPSDFYEIYDANVYDEAIRGCVLTKNIGDDIDVLNGNRVGPTNSGVDDLLAANPNGAIVAIGMFSPAAFWAMDRQSGNFDLTIVNMLAFKIDHRQGNEIVGTIVGAASTQLTVCNAAPCPTSTGLLSVIRLVR